MSATNDCGAVGPLDSGRSKAAFNDNRASDILLDQYYTHEEVAAHFYSIFKEHFDPALYQMVEPSAGTGSFF